jgi:hypothetical protein
VSDHEGAITAARTLVETVCKHILDDANVTYDDNLDLPKLWALTAKEANLAPQQHQEGVFRAILGDCQSVVNNLAAIWNREGDAHGQGRRQVRPKPRHAELAVNLAGTMAAFLVATWHDRGARRSASMEFTPSAATCFRATRSALMNLRGYRPAARRRKHAVGIIKKFGFSSGNRMTLEFILRLAHSVYAKHLTLTVGSKVTPG